MGETPHKSAAPIAPVDPEEVKLGFDHHPAWGLIGVTLGVVVILAAGFYEQRTANARPLANLLFGFGETPAWVDPIIIQSRRLPKNEFPSVYDAVEEFRNTAEGPARGEIDRFIEATGIMDTERILSVPLRDEELLPALASGRLPERGKAELLAGAHARLDEFSIDGQKFTVTGRLQRSAAGLHFAYLIPKNAEWHELFDEHPATESGWLDLQGREKLRTLRELPDDFESFGTGPLMVPADPRVTAATITGLMLVALFGAMAHLSFFRVLMSRKIGPLRPAIRVILTYPRLTIAMHLLCFGSMFLMMLAATRAPVPQMWIFNLVQHAFREGELKYVADAYGSGNVLHAAAMTFVNNYLVQTLGFTFVASLIIPCIGILKTIFSFALVGFGMSPIWAGTAMRFSFHSITMTLELEAYILACCLVFFFWTHLALFIFKGGFFKRLKEGSKAILSGMLLTGIMLALAGLYEAATLIAAAR